MKQKVMKQKVKWSNFAWIITILVTIALCASIIICRVETWRFTTLIILTATIFILMWMLSPVSISIDKHFITIHRRCSDKRIAMSKVNSVSPFIPMIETGMKFCGSGGFAGYWGRHYDSRIGSYTAYYGNRKDCFLITLKDGRHYVLGCENASEMADYIKDNI